MPRLTTAGRTLGLLLLLACAAGVTPAEAKTYVAERFDSRVEVLRGGDLRVIETVVFRFERGSFKEVFREIPSQNSDGIEFVRASMDGRTLPPGRSAGEVEVRSGRRLRVRWRFAPTSASTHTFEVEYVIRGVVRREAEADALVWRALPGQHSYRIESSTIEVALPVAPAGRATTTRRKVEALDLSHDGTVVRLRAGGIRSDGWIEVRVPLPAGSVIAQAPAWQMRREYQRQMAPTWIISAAGVLLGILVLLFAVHQGYDSPHRERTSPAGGPARPDTLSPAEAGALVANGSPRIEHAMAALVALAARGEIVIAEEPRGRWATRKFVLSRRAGRRPLSPFEQAAVDAAFTHRGQLEDAVPLDKARTRLAGHFKPFKRALGAELKAHGLLDDGRQAVRDRYTRLGVVLLIAAGVAAAVMGAVFVRRFGPWPLLIPAVIAAGSVVAFIAHASHTPLSNEGVRRARAWRGYQEWLRDVARDRTAAPPTGSDELLPYAIALGLASAWSKYLTKHRLAVPAWFQPVAAADGGAAFVAFVAHGGATASSGGGAGAGGAAGGGSSGAG
jgi:hypothetical protein